MNRDVCGICWCPYDDNGACGCKPQTGEGMNNTEIFSVAERMASHYVSGYCFNHADIAAFARWAAGQERERIIQFLQEMQRQVGDAHNHYGVAAVRIKERV